MSTSEIFNEAMSSNNNGPVATDSIPAPAFRHQSEQINGNESEDEYTETENYTETAIFPLEQLDFRNYPDRLKSYKHWQNDNLSKETLAKAGFYYTNSDDVVRCAFCGIEGYKWASGDDPMKDHTSWSPDCPFVINTQRNKRSFDITSCQQVCQNSVPEDETKLQKLGIQKKKGPVYADKFTYTSRLSTFKYWPKYMKQKPHDLAEAGFFYAGVGDRTLCFHCGNGVKDWEEHDIPWEEHAFWFPNCEYLLLNKGLDFIEEVNRKKDPRGAAAVQCSSEENENTISEQLNAKLSLENENVNNEKTLCKICYKNEVGLVFLPCGHIVACIECSEMLKTCAVCRKPVEATVRAFLS